MLFHLPGPTITSLSSWKFSSSQICTQQPVAVGADFAMALGCLPVRLSAGAFDLLHAPETFEIATMPIPASRRPTCMRSSADFDTVSTKLIGDVHHSVAVLALA